MTTNIDIDKEEELKDLRTTKAKKGLIALAAVGIGCGILGFKLGYKTGAKDGIIYAQKQIYDTMKELAEAARGESKGK